MTSTLNVLESSPAWQRRTISCPTRSADLLPFMVGHYTSNYRFKISHICGITFVQCLHYRQGNGIQAN